MDPLTLSEAMERACALGVESRLLVGVVVCKDPPGLVAVTTSDPSCQLEFVSGSGPQRSVLALAERSQSGPDRWDYPVAKKQLSEGWVLRLKQRDATCDVPVLSASRAVAHAHGWTGLVEGALAEPLVEYHAFRRAVEIVRASQ